MEDTGLSESSKIGGAPRVVDDALIEEITRRIVEAFHSRRVILFGSRARGDYRPDSDIDLFIEMESKEKPWKRRMKVSKLFHPRPWAMDFLVYTPREVEERKNSFASIVPDILKEGRILFDAANRS